jgi:hypothetical protein
MGNLDLSPATAQRVHLPEVNHEPASFVLASSSMTWRAPWMNDAPASRSNTTTARDGRQGIVGKPGRDRLVQGSGREHPVFLEG